MRWRSLWLTLFCSAAAHAAPWSPDATFGDHGVATVSFGTYVDPDTGAALGSYASRLIALPDGGSLALGAQQTGRSATSDPPPPYDGYEYSRVLVRLDASGAIVTSFGTGGVLTLATQANVPGTALAREPNGRIVVADTITTDFQTYVAVTRYHADGTIDRSFGVDGVAVANAFPLESYYATSAVVARDGAIVVVGHADQKATERALVARFTAEGSLDHAFGVGGVVVLSLPTATMTHDVLTGVVEQPDGKLVVVGTHLDRDPTTLQQRNEALALRLLPDGTLDPSFGSGGRALIPPGAGAAMSAASVALRPDGRILLGGGRYTSGSVAPVLVGLTASGGLDDSFGANGIAVGTRAFYANAIVTDLFLQGDGRVVTANSALASDGRPSGGFLARYDRHGAPDDAFGTGGVVLLAGFGRAEAVSQQADGKWLAGGALAPALPSPDAHDQPFALTRIVGGPFPAVEFHRADVDHYFVTSNPLEVADLDNGVHPGWARTGATFEVFGSRDATTMAASDVCRYYIPPAVGDSHFLSGSAAECAAVASKVQTDPNYAGYVLESNAAFMVPMPDVSSGACASGSLPVYRLWNRKIDSNHRYTTVPATRDAMVAAGWVSEGYGSDGVAMCAVAPSTQ